MEKSQSNVSLAKQQLKNRFVYLYIQSEQMVLAGDWNWEMVCDQVFCSNVMLTLPAEFIGTVGLIHPEDLESLKERVKLIKEISLDIHFRIITTYGEIKTLTGRNISFATRDDSDLPLIEEKLVEKATKENELRKGAAVLELLQQLTVFSESITDCGTFYINSSTNEAHYSDQVFKIYGLPPQSLNPHFNTFINFVHPKEREVVAEAFEKAYKEHLPLNLDFRIVTNDLNEKYLQYSTQWKYNSSGAAVLCGVVQEITGQRKIENNEMYLQSQLSLQESFLHLAEQAGNLGYWQINLQTRKTVFSDNIYRIHGVKPQSLPAGFSFLRELVHPDDRLKVTEMIARILSERAAPDLEYRIVRKDGKVRQIQQRGKIIRVGREELMTGIIRDVTHERRLEKRTNEIHRQLQLKELGWSQSEEVIQTGYWMYDLDNEQFTWSENLFRLLGYKPNSVQLTEKHFLTNIHPDDRKNVSDALAVSRELSTESDVDFRLVIRGETRHMKATFKNLRFADKKVFIAIIQDISREYRKEEELLNRLYLTQSLSENIVDRVIITDLNHNIILWNHACEAVYNLKKEEVLGKNLFEIIPALNNEQDHKLFSTALKGEIVNIKNRKSLLRKEYYNLQLVPLKNADNAVTGIIHILQDVTREFELQHNLTIRLNFIERLHEATIDRVVALDRYMNIMVWNKKSEEYFKRRKQEVIGKNILEALPHIINEPVYFNFRAALRGEIVHIPATEGAAKEKYFETYLIPVKDEKEEVNAVLWVMHDLSIEFEMLQQQKKADEILNSIDEAYVEVDENGVLCYVNRMAEEIWKTPKEELLNKSISEVLPETVRPGVYNIITSAAEGKKPSGIEFFADHLNQWLYISARPTDNGAIVLFYDITERKKAEEKLTENQIFIERLTVATPDILFLTNLQTKKVTYTNRPVAEALGYTSEQIAKMEEPYFHIMHPMDVERMVTHLENIKTISDGEVRDIEYRMKTATGAIRRFVDRNAVFERDNNGVPIVKIGISEDITLKKEQEREIEQNIHYLLQDENFSHLGTWEYDVSSQEFKWSDRMYRLFEMKQGAVVTPEVYLEYAVENDQPVAKRIAENIRKNHADFEEILSIKVNGTEKKLKIKAVVLNDEDDKPAKVLGIDVISQ